MKKILITAALSIFLGVMVNAQEKELFNTILTEYNKAIESEYINLAIEKLNELKIEAYLGYEDRINVIDKNIEILSSYSSGSGELEFTTQIDTMLNNFITGFYGDLRASEDLAKLENDDANLSMEVWEKKFEIISQQQFVASGKWMISQSLFANVKFGVWAVSPSQEKYIGQLYDIWQACWGSASRWQTYGTGADPSDGIGDKFCKSEDFASRIDAIGRSKNNYEDILETLFKIESID